MSEVLAGWAAPFAGFVTAAIVVVVERSLEVPPDGGGRLAGPPPDCFEVTAVDFEVGEAAGVVDAGGGCEV